MDDNRWWGWAGLIILFLIIQAWRALFRAARSGNSGMARLNAAAERILKERGLKERGASASNPIPRTQGLKSQVTQNQSAATRPRAHAATTTPRTQATLPISSTPAVIRRSTMLSGGREPVVQRRR